MSRRPEDSASEPRPSLTPVARGGLTDRVIDQLRHRIADGTWTLHQRLPVEIALAKELGVGRSTIREAVRVLVHAGMLEVRQGNGTFVRARHEVDAALRRRVTGAHLVEAFEVRRTLEIEIARLAAQRRTDADAACLAELAERREAAYPTSTADFRKADLAVREHLLAMAGNALLADLYRGVVGPLRAAIPASFDESELTRDDPERPEMRELVQAVTDRDPAAAAAAERHMDNALRVLRLLVQVMIVES